MLLNVSDVFSSEGKVMEVEIPLELAEVMYNGENFSVIDKTDAKLILTNIGTDQAEVEGTASITISIPCNRCLEDVENKISLQFERTITPELERNEVSEDDDAGVMEGYHLNVETLIYNEILMSWPLKVLCKNDCKGICKQCGADLNKVSCECDTFIPDPRMAAIKDIFDANKEV